MVGGLGWVALLCSAVLWWVQSAGDGAWALGAPGKCPTMELHPESYNVLGCFFCFLGGFLHNF